MVYFNVPPTIGTEIEYVTDAINSHKICGDGKYSKICSEKFENITGAEKVLMLTSGSAALDMSAILANINPGDEVIMSSYTFVSTANAFVLRGAKIVFVDIRPDTMNIDENLIDDAISEKTKAIVPVHYAGVSCEMDKILEIAKKYNLLVIEDAAQAVMSMYKGKALGTIGNIGCYSFHETKNYSMGEGGAILINDAQLIERAEIIREKGTNRSKFYRGQVDKYTWCDVGSSYLQSDINCAYLYAQIKDPSIIFDDRMNSWNKYFQQLKVLQDEGKIELPFIPDNCVHNAHMFYIKCKDLDERTQLIKYLKDNDVMAVFHYIPLHTSPAGGKFGRFNGEDKFTTKESERILRLPLYFGLKEDTVIKISDLVKGFYR